MYKQVNVSPAVFSISLQDLKSDIGLRPIISRVSKVSQDFTPNKAFYHKKFGITNMVMVEVL